MAQYPPLFARINEVLGSTPHLTRIHALHSSFSFITAGRNIPSWYPVSVGKFFHREWHTGVSPRREVHMVTVMELLEGDMEQNYSNIDKHTYNLQIIFSEYILQQKYGIIRQDIKDRNILCKQLEPTDTFNGKKLADYDFWKYTLDGVDYYIPRPTLLIKFADYDAWSLIDSKSSGESLQSMFNSSGFSSSVLQARFPKPQNPNATILDMGSC